MKATYISPRTCSIMTNDRACAWTGTTSDRPVDVSVVNDR